LGELLLRVLEIARQRLGELSGVAPRVADERPEILVQIAGALADIPPGVLAQLRERLFSGVERAG
jgi:hypothetical protein